MSNMIDFAARRRRLRSYGALPPVESQRAERFQAVHTRPEFYTAPVVRTWSNEEVEMDRIVLWLELHGRALSTIVAWFVFVGVVFVLAYAMASVL